MACICVYVCLCDLGCSVDEIKRYGRWKSNSTVEGYVYSSKNFKRKMAKRAFGVTGDDRGSVQNKKQKGIHGGSSSCGVSGGEIAGFGTFNFNACNVTMNFYKEK